MILDSLMHPRCDHCKRTVRADGTHIADSIFEAARHLNRAANPASRRVIIVVTDNQSWESWTLYAKKTVRNELIETGPVVYGIVTNGWTGRW